MTISRRNFLAGLFTGGLGAIFPFNARFSIPHAGEPVQALYPGDARDGEKWSCSSGQNQDGPFVNYSFSAIYPYKNGIIYRVRACAQPNKLVYILSGIPLWDFSRDDGSLDGSYFYLSPSSALSRCVETDRKSMAEFLKNFTILSGDFLTFYMIKILPDHITEDGSSYLSGLEFRGTSYSVGYNYDIRLSCYNEDGMLFFEEIKEIRPSYKPKQGDYIVDGGTRRAKFFYQLQSFVFIVPETLVENGFSSVKLVFTNLGRVKDLPGYAKISHAGK